MTQPAAGAATTATEPAPADRPAREHHPMLGFVVRRTLRMLGSLAALLVLSFAMIHLIPGDPVRAQLGPKAPAALVEQRTHELGLDRPIVEQFGSYVGGLATGDLGESAASRLPVSQVIGDRLPHTVRLAGLAFLLIMGLAIPIGMVAAILTRDGRGRVTEAAFTTTTGFFATIPEFVLGVGLVYVFGVSAGWLPVAYEPGPAAYVLPLAALSIGSVAALSRIVRAETLTVLGEDYLRTARSKRLPSRLVYLRHTLPNMLTSTLTLGGLLLAGLVGGTVLVENVFAWPGIGTTVVRSVVEQDFQLAQALIMLLGAAVLVSNLVVDLLLGFIDPRSAIRDQ